MRRREFLATTGAVAAGSTVWAQGDAVKRKGRIKQGVTQGVFARGTSLEECCRAAARLGIQGFDLIGPMDWPLLRRYGLTPSMYPQGPGGTIPDALNRVENHDRLYRRTGRSETCDAGTALSVAQMSRTNRVERA